MLKVDLFVKNYEPCAYPYYAAKKLQEALSSIEIEAKVVEVFEGNFSEYLNRILDNPPDCTISFSNFSTKQTSELMCEHLRIPHLFWTHAPYFYLNYLKSDYGYLGCTDRFHTQHIQNSGLSKISFLPHAIDPEIFVKSSYNRFFEVVLFEDLIDCDSLWLHWKNTLSPQLFKVVGKAVGYYESQDLVPVHALLLALKEEGIPIENNNHGWLLYELEEYLKGQRLVQLIESLEGVRIDVFGKHQGRDWLKRLKNASNVYLHTAVAYLERFKILKNSQLLIRDQCFLPEGSDDWVLNAIAMGCIVLTNGSKFLKDHFQSDKELFFYPEEDWKLLNQMATFILKGPIKQNLIIESAQIKALNHSWKHRAHELIPILNAL